MPDRNDLQDLPIIRELGVSIRAAAATEDDRIHHLALRLARRRRRLTLSAVGIACVGAVALTISSSFGGPGSPPMADAASVLSSTARVAAQQNDALPDPDQYFYVRSTNKGYTLPATASAAANGDHAIRAAYTREIWTSIDRPGRLLTTPLSGQGAPTPSNGRVGNIPAQGSYRLGSLKLSAKELDATPADPPALLARLRDAAVGRGNSPDTQVFDDIAEALAEQPIPARVRSTLYRTLATIPGIELVRRPGASASTTIALGDCGVRHELTFDAQTSQLTSIRDVATAPTAGGTAAGTALRETIYNDREITTNTKRP